MTAFTRTTGALPRRLQSFSGELLGGWSGVDQRFSPQRDRWTTWPNQMLCVYVQSGNRRIYCKEIFLVHTLPVLRMFAADVDVSKQSNNN